MQSEVSEVISVVNASTSAHSTPSPDAAGAVVKTDAAVAL
jgi:hypothetical protein